MNLCKNEADYDCDTMQEFTLNKVARENPDETLLLCNNMFNLLKISLRFPDFLGGTERVHQEQMG